MPMRVDETLAIAALIQATIAKLYKLHSRRTRASAMYSRALIMENKWRAARYGIDGKLIDFGLRRKCDERELILEYLDFVDDVRRRARFARGGRYIQTMLEHGTGRRSAAEGVRGDRRPAQVVAYMVEETQAGL